MKVAKSRIVTLGVSAALHAAALYTLFELGRTTAPFVPATHLRSMPLVFPPPDAPVIARHQPPIATPTQAPSVSIGILDAAAEPDIPAPRHPAPSRIATGGLSDASDPAPGSSGTKGEIVTGVLGGDPSDHGSGASTTGGGGSGRSDESGGADEPPRLLSAPRAAYTEEARRLNIKGSVVLRVLLTRSGTLRVLAAITAPLGHGLDESARDAAQAIEFEPARKQGKPVDYITTVRVVFDLT